MKNLPQSLLEQLNTILYLMTFSISERYIFLLLSVLGVLKFISNFQQSPNNYSMVPRHGGQIWTWQCVRDRYADWNIYLQLVWMLAHHKMKMELYLTI